MKIGWRVDAVDDEDASFACEGENQFQRTSAELGIEEASSPPIRSTAAATTMPCTSSTTSSFPPGRTLAMVMI